MIFYFSGTGNTRWAATQLAEATGEPLVYIPHHIQDTSVEYDFREGERIGFCFPVHGWRPPTIVRKFIEKLNISTQGHYTYALCTAGDTTGEAMDIFEADLNRRGMHLNAVFSLIMPESYVGLPFMDVDSSENEKRKIEAAQEKLKRYISAIAERKEESGKIDIGHWPRINSRLIGSFFTHFLITDKRFRVDSERCVKCGICAKVCPVHDIEGGAGHAPRWKHDGSCLTCFTCYHHCPHHAIEFGRQTKKKGQYFFNHNKPSTSNKNIKE